LSVFDKTKGEYFRTENRLIRVGRQYMIIAHDEMNNQLKEKQLPDKAALHRPIVL
jgi:hypothetical protein